MNAERLEKLCAKYLAFAGVGARRAVAERTALLGRAVFLGVILFIFSRIWRLIGVSAAIPGVGPRELVWYLAVTEWSVLSVPPVFLAIEADVRSGDIACRLVRPVAYLGGQIAEALGETALRLAVLGPASFACALLLAGGLPADPRGLLLALPLGVFASALAVLCMTAIGISAFWIVDTSPVLWIWQKLVFVLGGLLFPLDLYPDWLRRLAQLSPFPLFCWAPGRMAFGFAPRAAAGTALQGALWTAILAALLFALSRRARLRLTVNGG